MQGPRVEEPMTRNYDAMSSPSQCSQRYDTQEGLKKQRPTRSNLKAKWKAQIDPMRPESYHVYNCDKKGNHSNACRELKGLVPVGDLFLVAGEDIPDLSRDCVPCIYHLIFFQKIKKKFGLWSTGSEISTLTLADVSGLTVWSTNVGSHKIDGLTLKPLVFSR